MTDVIRSWAVENVDGRHGYTYEFSGSPGAHLAEYDDEEDRLREQPVWTITRLAGRTGCTKAAIRKAVTRGALPGGVRIDEPGRPLAWTEAQVQRWLSTRRPRGRPRTGT